MGWPELLRWDGYVLTHAHSALASERLDLHHSSQNNWNTFACDVSEPLLLETSKIMIDTGLRDLGYNYVVLDDCWSEKRGADGYLVVDGSKFPNGMKSVADSLHDEGFLFGMYSSAGEYTCARYRKLSVRLRLISQLMYRTAGSLDFEEQDAESFASWGVDYLKYGVSSPQMYKSKQ